MRMQRRNDPCLKVADGTRFNGDFLLLEVVHHPRVAPRDDPVADMLNIQIPHRIPDALGAGCLPRVGDEVETHLPGPAVDGGVGLRGVVTLAAAYVDGDDVSDGLISGSVVASTTV